MNGATETDVKLVPAGKTWDAIKLPTQLGHKALDAMTVQHGAVIADSIGRALYVLVPPGSTRGWELQHTTPLGATAHVLVPPAGKTSGPGVHWLSSPTDGPLHTPVDALREAIETVLGPRPEDVEATS